MFLRRLSSTLRPGHCFRQSEGIPDLLKICLRNQSNNRGCHKSFAYSITFARCLTLRRSLSTSAQLLNRVNTSVESEIIIEGNDVPGPCHDFHEIKLEEHILQELKMLGFEKPTTIQGQCLPVAISGRDLVGIGQTGSGKTLAYLLPALVHLSKQKAIEEGVGPTVLILAPTRELAQQISSVLAKFRHISGIRSVCLFGGVPKGPQIRSLQYGVHVCIATPGRLIDLVGMGTTHLSQVSYLVLDEADRMLDMGFEPQIRKIVDAIGQQHRQTLMWSATWPPEVQSLARDFLNNAVHITVGSTELMANPNITQNIHICSQMDKPQMLFSLLEDILSEGKNKVLVFAETKGQVDVLTRNLVWKKIQACSIHGDKSQMQRDKAINDFRRGDASVLIATDVAARGLDITDITHIINYDFPRVTDTYVHRIGRTARGERKGVAHSFFTPENKSLAKELIAVLEMCNQTVDPELLKMAHESGHQRRSSSLQYFGKQNKNYGQRNNFRQNSSLEKIIRFGDD